MEVINFELLSDKKSSLEALRGKIIQGQMIIRIIIIIIKKYL